MSPCNVQRATYSSARPHGRGGAGDGPQCAEGLVADRGKAVDLVSLGKITQAAFGQRRKMLRASLKTLNMDVGMLLERAQITETARAEELSVADFVRLTLVHDEMAA